MGFNPENYEDSLRHIIEGPKSPEGLEPGAERRESLPKERKLPPTNEFLKPKARARKVLASEAHTLAKSFLGDPHAKGLLKRVIAERVACDVNVTKLDNALDDGELSLKEFGYTKSHIADVGRKDFLEFDLVTEDDRVALSFAKVSGEPCLRYLDDAPLADILDQTFLLTRSSFLKISEFSNRMPCSRVEDVLTTLSPPAMITM